MSSTRQPSRVRARAELGEPSGWVVGWAVFAASMMLIQGMWWVMAGLVAIINDQFYVATEQYVFQFDVSTWGWIHMVVGGVILAAGIALLTGAMWARVVAVIVASVAAILAFAWLPYYPVWALLFIGVSGAVIWALTAHGRELKSY